MKYETHKVEFRGGYRTAFLPILIFLLFCIYYFLVLHITEMHVLAMGALVSLLLSSLLVRPGNYDNYWSAVYDGISESIPVILLLLMIGMFTELIAISDISSGFVWIANQFDMTNKAFTASVFLFTAIIATASGSSIGTMFTCFPIFFPAGILLGGDPAIIAAAIVSGGIFGDNLAPISDTTIISSSTQHYKNKVGVASVGESVATRLKYSLVSGGLSLLLFYVISDGSTVQRDVQLGGSPKTLVMLAPIIIMLIIAVYYKNMYIAITVGIILGTVLGLLTNIISLSDIVSIEDDAPVGFLTDGVKNMLGITTLIIGVYGIMGVLNRSGALEKLIAKILNSKLGQSVAGTEFAMMFGIVITTLLFFGVTSASMSTFGKIQNELGQRVCLHPTRRANLLDGFANSIPLTVPFLSIFVFLGSQLTNGYQLVEQVSLIEISKYMFHSYLLFIVFIISIVTGWGRDYEDDKGEKIQ